MSEETEQQQSVEEPPAAMERIKTNCKIMDVLTDGGLATGTITQIFGEKALGKSLISLQASFSAVANGHSAIILDTEQSYFSYLAPYWVSRMSKRFGSKFELKPVKLEKIPKTAGGGKRNKPSVTRSQVVTSITNTLNQLGITYGESQVSSIADMLCPEFQVNLDDIKGPTAMVIQAPEVTDLLMLHGINAVKEVSEGSRVELKLKATPVYESVLHNIIKQTKAKLLVYDSISAPFKASFPSTQDLPARSAGLAMLLAHAQRLCVDFGIAVVTVSHVSIDPIKAWDRRPYGGVILGHEAKFSFELTKAQSKRNQEAEEVNPEDEGDGEDTRRIWVARHPAMAEYSKFGYAKVDHGGFH